MIAKSANIQWAQFLELSPIWLPFGKPKSCSAFAIFLASCPVVSIESGILTSLKFGGEYSAGDAYDKLNYDVLDPANEAWKTAWKGKTSQAYRMMKRIHRNEKIVVVAIKGGPACDWERDELQKNFCPK